MENELIYNDVVPTKYFMEKHEVTWKIADFAKMKTSREAMELQYFDLEMGSSIDIPSKWKFSLKWEIQDGFYRVRPDVDLIECNSNMNKYCIIIIVFYQSKCGQTVVRGQIGAFKTNEAPIKEALVPKVGNLLLLPTDPDDSLSLNVKSYICNILNIPHMTHSSLTLSLMTAFHEPKFSNKLSQDLRYMYKEGLGITACGQHLGVKFITKDGREFSANRAILGVRSPVIRSMFQTPMFEAQEGVVKIDDISGPAFEALLHFMYTGKLPENWKEPEILEEFIYGAFKYMLEDLQQFFAMMLVFLCSDEEQGNKHNLEQLADMLNIEMEKDWDICLENFIKDCLDGPAVRFMFEQLKLKEMEPRFVLAIITAMLP